MSAEKPQRDERFEQLVTPLEKQVYFTCFHMMGNREDAEDCAQEALLKACRNLDSFRNQSRFSTWLYTLVTRVCLDALRKKKNEYSLDLLREEGFEPASEEAEAYLQLEEKERKMILKKAVSQLPLDFRAAVVLVDLQGLPYQEASEALGVPEGTLKSRVSRARKALYQILVSQGELFTPGTRLNDERRQRHEL